MRPRGRPRTFDRQQALERAVTVFLARGYDGATLEELLDAMGGIAPPSFYAAFGSKERLFREAVDYHCETTGSRGRAALGAPKVRPAIEGLLRASIDVYCDPSGPRGCLLVLGAMNCTKANRETHDHLRTLRLHAAALIEQRLARAATEGELAAGLDCAGIASFYATILHGLAIRARDGASRAVLLAAVDGAMAAWPSLTARPKAAPRRTGAAKRRAPRR
jgi:AcrR family transcriptional regulator